jgi:serine/threonine-protein kinase RsbW
LDTLKISLPGKPEYMTMVRLATGSIACHAGFDIEETDEIKLAVQEACKNVSCHGCGAFSDKYEIQYMVAANEIAIKVYDVCKEHTLEKKEKPCKHCPEEGDIGAIMIRSLMDSVEMGYDEEGYKYISMVKRK